MSSKHLLDPELLPGLELLPKIEFSADMLPMIRQQVAALISFSAAPDVTAAKVEEHKAVTAEGREIAVLVHTPRKPGTARPAVLHMHGGGYIIGSAKMSVAANLKTALEADCVVASVDYRLAPETAHPSRIATKP